MDSGKKLRKDDDVSEISSKYPEAIDAEGDWKYYYLHIYDT
jgi:hypothetical protein